jgi:hypothetical protein
LEVLDRIDDMRSLSSVADLTTLIAQTPSDYSYFSFDRLKLHDLPRHLKRIAAQLAADGKNNGNQNDVNNNNENAGERIKQARNRRETAKVTFTFTQDLSKFFKVTKKATFLCDRTIEKRSEKPIRQETERQFDYNAKEMFQPYYKAVPAKIFSEVDPIENLLLNEDRMQPNGHRPGANNDDDDEGHMGGLDDDFGIPFTAQTNAPFVSQNGGEYAQSQQMETLDGVGAGGGGGGGDEDMVMENFTGHAVLNRFDGDNLVEAPLQVNALNIDYAKTSKNIDVRKLKHVIWKLLCENNDKVMLLVSF